jgi:hypothetical protein
VVPDPAAVLLRRCLLSVDDHGAALDADRLPHEVVTAVADRMAEADPQADTELRLRCEVCEHGWSALFDIPSFLWTELDAWARRALYDVHTLARAYGWTESDILRLSPRRRQHYLELALS